MAERDQGRLNREAATPVLADLVAPLTAPDFLAQYWNHAFHAWPGQAGRFAALIGWDEINHVLTTQRLEPPRLMLVKGGKNVATERFVHASGANRRIDAGAVTAQLAQGATLVLSFVDEMVPRIGVLADRLGSELGARCNINLYAGWRADNGFDLHWDRHDVFILQVAGRKHWRVHRPTRDFATRGEEAPPLPKDDAPVFDAVLEEGAILYIPRGWWHVATPVEEPSLHLTVALSPPSGQDYLRWLVGKALADPRFRADWPVAAGEAATTAYWHELGAAMQALHAAHPPTDFLAAQLAERVARPRFTLPEFAAGTLPRLTDDSRLRLASARAMAPAHDPASGDFGLWVGDRFQVCSESVGAVLGRLSSGSDTDFAALAAGLDAAARRELAATVVRLAAAGAIFVDLDA